MEEAQPQTTTWTPEMFQQMHGYVLISPEPNFLEPLTEVQEDIAAGKQLFREIFGMNDAQMQVINAEERDFPDFQDGDWLRMQKISQDSPNDKNLVTIYYKGHSEGMDGLLEANLDFQTIKLEDGARCIAGFPNLYVLCLFDCCRRNQGRSGQFTSLESTKNLVCIYRNENEPYDPRRCNCEPWSTPNMAKEFREHLASRQADRLDKGIMIPEDVRSFKPDIEHCIQGWPYRPESTTKQEEADLMGSQDEHSIAENENQEQSVSTKILSYLPSLSDLNRCYGSPPSREHEIQISARELAEKK